MSHPLFGPEIKEMLEDRDEAGLKAFCESLHPATAAEALEELTPDQIWQSISPSDIRTQAAIFEYLPISRQVEMVEGKARPQLGQLIGKMSHDDRVDLLRRLTGRVKEALLRLVDEADRRDIATLFELGENTVGALMTTDYAWLSPTLTAAEAIDQLRQQAPDRETIYYVYVLDEAKRRNDGAAAPRKLLGVISLRDLILAPRHALIRDLMEVDLVSLKIGTDREEAAELLARYDFIAIPVLDDQGGMVGIVTHDDVIDVLKAEATEDLQRQAAVGPIEGSYLDAGFVSIWRKRTMWLSLLFGAGLLTGKAMEFFGPAIEAVKVLAFFVPLCIATGGNSGTQAATLITRALALGEITLQDWWRVLWHELRMGLAMGVTLSFFALIPSMIVGSESLVAKGEPFSRIKLALVLGQAVMCICLFGTIIGSMLPLLLKRCGIDPALASSPFVSTTVDVSGIMIYFAIASVYLL
jgi:magnesium transporter